MQTGLMMKHTIVCLLEQQQLNHLPIKAADIQSETANDPVLSQVYNFTVRGWTASSNSVLKEVKPFYKKHFVLTTFNVCLLYYTWFEGSHSQETSVICFDTFT